MKLKVLSIVGTRPEIIRLSRVFNKLDKYCDHILVHTGQNYDYELNQVFFDDLDIRQPNYFLNSAVNTSSPINVIGNILINIDKVLDESMPCSSPRTNGPEVGVALPPRVSWIS